VLFDAGGDRVAAVADGGHVAVWNTATGEIVGPGPLVAHGGTGLGHPAFSADGRLIAVGTKDGFVQVWDVQSGVTLILAHQHGDYVNDVLFAPGDDGRLISASDDTTVAAWPCLACVDQESAIRDALAAAGRH
jgi:WD40 repeat protein